ncbi:MAG TPA: hypothetical protein VJW75_00985, partial [Candidatus Eisenbacteria bacterium]|nr:hypothetical protein [Candidatus Eisenbacteria bacterium]
MKARGVLKIAHRVSQGILETAREEGCNFLLLGRSVARSLLERLVASVVERIIDDAPNQVGVVYGDIVPERVRGVVAPVTSGANSQLASELASAFATRFRTEVRALTVIPTELADEEAETLARRARDTLQAAHTGSRHELIRGRDVGAVLIRALREDELVLIGAPRTDPVAAVLSETIPAIVAECRRGPTIVVRGVDARHPGRFKRFFLGRK